MATNKALQRCSREATECLFKAIRFEAELFRTYFYFKEHARELEGTYYQTTVETIKTWLETFLPLLNQNVREWNQISRQLSLIENVDSIETWISAREELFRPHFLG